ncbi:hydrogenase maturation protease [Kosmotoga sp.]|nr:hydrogenase maturation protease [Kosmotoga sp.]
MSYFAQNAGTSSSSKMPSNDVPTDILHFVASLMNREVLFVGLGNPMRSDDYVGVFLIELLEKLKLPPHWNLLKCYRNPENYLGKLLSLKSGIIVFIDSVQGMNEELRIFREEEIKDFSFSTHAFGISTFMKYLKSRKEVNFFLIGIKPENLEVGINLTPEVKRRADLIFKGFEKVCKNTY